MRIRPAVCSRRSVLAGGAGVVAGLTLAACTPPGEPSKALAQLPDDEAVDRAITQARRLRAGALALVRLDQDLAGTLQDVAAGHAAHLTALGAPLAAPVTPASSTSSPAPGSAAKTSPGAQLKGEWAAAREALRDAISAQSPGLAVLLGRIAAARAVHADLLGAQLDRPELPQLVPATALASPAASASATAPATATARPAPSDPATVPDTAAELDDPGQVTPPTLSEPSTPWLVALNRVLAGEHAAVFAYPLVIAQLTGKGKDDAEDLWQAHQASRNELTQILVSARAEPAPAAAAYAIGERPATPRAADRLAARVERGLTGLAGDALGAAKGTKQRSFAAGQLVTSARRWAAWSGSPAALPGLPAPATPSASSSAAPTSAGPASAGPTRQP